MSTERLSDAEIDQWAAKPAFHTLWLMARELWERRDAERAVAPAVENPYRFTVRLTESNDEWDNRFGWQLVLDGVVLCEVTERLETEARAALPVVAAALRNVEVEQ